MKEKGISKRKGANTGFTLVELLVVIAIIALLMSILMPALRRVKMQAEEVKCKANLRQVGITIFLYLQEESFKMADCHFINDGNPDAPSNDCNRHLWTTDGHPASPRLQHDEQYSYWPVAYNEYVKDIDIFGCSAIRQFAEMLANDLLYNYPLHPDIDPKDVIQTAAFGLNAYIDRLNTNSVQNHAEIVICTDHVEPRNEQSDENDRGDMFCRGIDDKNLSHYKDGNGRDEHYRGIFRHNIRKGDEYRTGGRACILFLGGNVDSIDETSGMKDPYYPTGKRVPNRWYDPRGRWLPIN